MEQLFGIQLVPIIKTFGIFGVAAAVFAESGLLIGLFLPGDSLLFTAGFLASQHFLDIKSLVFFSFFAAVLGDNFGYAFGKKIGPKIFKKKDSIFFRKENLEHARNFYEKHGPKTIVLARFLPIVRTFAPVLAGVGRMRYRTFVFYNVIGGALWTVGLGLLGYTLGRVIPNIDRYLLPIIALIILISAAPTALHVYKIRRRKARGNRAPEL